VVGATHLWYGILDTEHTNIIGTTYLFALKQTCGVSLDFESIAHHFNMKFIERCTKFTESSYKVVGKSKNQSLPLSRICKIKLEKYPSFAGCVKIVLNNKAELSLLGPWKITLPSKLKSATE